MNCDESRSALIESAFGELDAGTGLALHAHLATCPDCREEEQRLLALRTEVRGDTAPASAALRERVRRALPARFSDVRPRWFARPVPAYVAIAAALLSALLAVGAMRAQPERVATDPPALPAATPALDAPDRWFTSASCYVTGVDSAFRPTLFGDTARRRRDSFADSL